MKAISEWIGLRNPIQAIFDIQKIQVEKSDTSLERKDEQVSAFTKAEDFDVPLMYDWTFKS